MKIQKAISRAASAMVPVVAILTAAMIAVGCGGGDDEAQPKPVANAAVGTPMLPNQVPAINNTCYYGTNCNYNGLNCPVGMVVQGNMCVYSNSVGTGTMCPAGTVLNGYSCVPTCPSGGNWSNAMYGCYSTNTNYNVSAVGNGYVCSPITDAYGRPAAWACRYTQGAPVHGLYWTGYGWAYY